MLTLFLLVLALVLFILSGVNVTHPRLNLQSLGLACLTLALLLHFWPGLK